MCIASGALRVIKAISDGNNISWWLYDTTMYMKDKLSIVSHVHICYVNKVTIVAYIAEKLVVVPLDNGHLITLLL